jgi:hypothetical protein
MKAIQFKHAISKPKKRLAEYKALSQEFGGEFMQLMFCGYRGYSLIRDKHEFKTIYNELKNL